MNMTIVIVAVVMGFVLLILNAIFLGIIFFTQRRMNTVRQWPVVAGTVLTSTLEARHSSEGGYTNYPVILYAYQVGGQAFQGDRIAPGLEVGGTGAGKVVARYPVGAQVSVFYNPQNPSEAVLEHMAPAQFWIWFVLVIIDLSICGVAPVMIWAFSQ